MKVRFWGVRGSIPVPGRATNRYGGNTSCVEVRPKRWRSDHHRRRHRHSPPRQVADGGGVRRRQGHRLDPDQPHPLGSRPGPAVLLAAVPRGQPAPHLRPPARHCTSRPCSRRRTAPPYFPVPLSAMHADMQLPRGPRGRELRDRAREGHLHPAQPSVDRDRVPDRGRSAPSVVYCADTAPFTDVLLGSEFVHQAPSLDKPLPPAVAAELAHDARRRGRAREGRGPPDLRHAVHARPSTSRGRTGATRTPTTRSRSRARPTSRRCASSTTRRCAPTTTTTRSSRPTARSSAHSMTSSTLVSAYEGLEIPLGDE